MTPAEHLEAATDLLEAAREQYEAIVDQGRLDDDWRLFVIDRATAIAQVHATLAAIPQRYR